jgi:hypothetical protein
MMRVKLVEVERVLRGGGDGGGAWGAEEEVACVR